MQLLDGRGYSITQCHKQIQQNGRPHIGIDIGVPVGTSLYSTLSGIITVCNLASNPTDNTKDICKNYVNRDGTAGYGNMVIVSNGTYQILFGHLTFPSTPPNINGTFVNIGDVIGYSGNTGNSTGPHVHYEVRENNVPIDPWQFVNTSLPCRVF